MSKKLIILFCATMYSMQAMHIAPGNLTIAKGKIYHKVIERPMHLYADGHELAECLVAGLKVVKTFEVTEGSFYSKSKNLVSVYLKDVWSCEEDLFANRRKYALASAIKSICDDYDCEDVREGIIPICARATTLLKSQKEREAVWILEDLGFVFHDRFSDYDKVCALWCNQTTPSILEKLKNEGQESNNGWIKFFERLEIQNDSASPAINSPL